MKSSKKNSSASKTMKPQKTQKAPSAPTKGGVAKTSKSPQSNSGAKLTKKPKSSPTPKGSAMKGAPVKAGESSKKKNQRRMAFQGQVSSQVSLAAIEQAFENAAQAAAEQGNMEIAAELRREIYGPVNSAGEAICREVACDGLVTSGGYCRLHYIKNWKKIKRKELILKEGKLNQYIEELVAKYPDKYIEAIRQDLASDKEFNKVIHDLELDEGIDDFDMDSENVDNLIDSIKRDIDDEGDVY